MSSFVDEGWGDDEDFDVSATSVGDDGWGEDDDFFGDDGGDEEDDCGLGFPSAAPVIAQMNQASELSQSNNDQEDLNLDDGWGEDDDFFDEDSVDEKEDECIGFPLATATKAQSNLILEVSHSQSRIESTSFGRPSTTTQDHSIPTQESRHIPVQNDFNQERNPMVTEISKYIQSLDRMLSSINAVLELEYNTFEKADELLEYYGKRPQLAEYTRTKELQRMNYEIVLPDGYAETNKERIIDENLLPDNAIVSRAANQSLLADIFQVIAGHDLIVRPQYLASCIATQCKFVIHKGDHGADMIDCQALLSLFLPTTEEDRLKIAEVTVSVVFAPSRPMIEFRVVKIEVLLKDFSRLSGVADFLRAMDIPIEDHEVVGAPPDMYRDAFLEKSQRFFALSSEGMKSAFQQMDSVINFKGKMKSISSFIPDTDQVLAAEQEAIAYAKARKIELQQQQRESAFPRPPPPHHSSQGHEHTFPYSPPPQRSSQGHEQAFIRPLPPQNYVEGQIQNETKRPKSILGGLVRSGWKTLANSVTIPDDDPDIYGEFAPSQLSRAPDQHMKFYRKEEGAPAEGQKLYRNDGTQNVPNSNQGHESQMSIQWQGDSKLELQTSKISNKVSENEISDRNSFGLQSANSQSQMGVNRSVTGNTTTGSGQSVVHGLTNMDRERNHVQRDENPTEKNVQPEELPRLSRELGETRNQEVDEEAIDNDFEDGWDDSLDGFDDNSDNLEECSDLKKDTTEQDQERDNVSSDIVLVDLFIQNKKTPSFDEKYEEDDICDTRRRWVNPRPHRPYLK